MKALAATLATLVVACSALAATVDPADFRYERDLQSSGGLTAFEPDGPMYEHAALDLGDLRILDSSGQQVPWRLTPVRGDEQLRAATVLNAGTEGDAAVALLDFGPERVVRTRIQLDVPFQPFNGRAEVYGTDDRQRFTKLSSTAIYDVRGATRAVSTAVVFPPQRLPLLPHPCHRRLGDSRRHRGSLCNGSRAGRAGRDHHGAAAAAAHARRGRPALPERVGARGALRVVDTRLRPAGRDLRLERSEGVLPGRRRPSVPVRELGQTTVPVHSRYRYLRIRIANGDDPPLQDLHVTLHAYRDYVLLASGFAPPYRVLYGGSVAHPEYDFAEQPEVQGEPQYVVLGPERENESFEAAPDTRSYAERHPALITVALALAAAMLLAGGFLALRKRT